MPTSFVTIWSIIGWFTVLLNTGSNITVVKQPYSNDATLPLLDVFFANQSIASCGQMEKI
jgi:hypothetical protein